MHGITPCKLRASSWKTLQILQKAKGITCLAKIYWENSKNVSVLYEGGGHGLL